MRNYNISKLILFCVIFVTSLLVTNYVHSQHLNQTWQSVEFGEYIGESKIWCTDSSGDGMEKIICGGGGYPNRFFMILEYMQKDYHTTWTSKWYGSDPIQLIELNDIDQNGEKEIYVLLSSGKIDVYQSRTMELDTTYQTSVNNALSLNIADVDNDHQIEFILGGGNYSIDHIRIFNAITFNVEWDTTGLRGDCTDLKIGEVDNDGKNEIVLSSGIVLDGVNHHVQWKYPEGFGSRIELADIDRDSVQEIIGMSGWYYITAFDGEFNTPLWQINTGDDHDALYITDLENDGDIEVFMGNGQWGGINCYSASTQQLLWSINNPEHGVTNICVGDPDNDGVKEVIWGAGQSSTGSDHLFIGSTNYHQIEWQSIDLDGPFIIDVFDIDNDGINEIVGASQGSNSGYDGGVVLVYDGLTHALEWFTEEFAGLWDGNINAIAAGNINDTEQGEIIIGVGNKIFVLDGKTHQKLWESSELNTITSLQITDIDNDNTIEIIAGDRTGYIYVFNGKTFQKEWQSIDTGDQLEKIVVANCDEDDAKEIIFLNDQRRLQVYDGKSHYLEWQSSNLSNITSFDVNDFDLDGNKDIIIGHSNGQITTLTCPSFEISNQVSVLNEAIYGLVVANLDSVPGNEILLGTSKIHVINADDFSLKWESQSIGEDVGFGNNFKIFDVDMDQYMDVFVSSSWGMFQFEANTQYPDITPPKIIAYAPPDGLTYVGIDAEINVTFSESIDEASLTEATVFITANDTLTVNSTITYFDSTHIIVIKPDNFLPANNSIKVNITGNVSDTSMNGLDGNGNGIAEGSPIDDFSWSFTTGAYVDTVGPRITSATVEPDSLWKGIDITINAYISDSSQISISSVTYAECFIDTIGNHGSGLPLKPVDGKFDSVDEGVTLTVETENWLGGEHHIFLHSKDSNGNWGEIYQLSVYIITELAANWPIFGQNAQHTGFNESDSITLPLKVKWSKKLSDNRINDLAVANNLLFATNHVYFNDAILFVLNIEDGSEVWNYSFGDIFSINNPAFGYGYVYVQTSNHTPGSYVTAFDALSGKLVWQSSFSSQWSTGSGPTIADGKVFINAGYYGGMYAYDAFDGRELWFTNLQQEFDWTPAYFDGIVFAAWSGSSYQAFDAETGNMVYEVGNPGYSGYTAAIAKGKIFTVNPITAFSLASHEVIWSKSGSYTPAVAYNKVFSISNGNLYVYDEILGQTLWSFSGDNNLNHSPVVANGYVFVSSNDHTYVINIESQNLEWNYNKGGYLTLANNHLYIATATGEIIAFEEGLSFVQSEENDNLPSCFELAQNYPNPFNPSTTIEYSLPKSCQVKMEIFNQLGKLVETLVNEKQTMGFYQVQWRPKNLASGIYFYKLKTNEFTNVKKLLFLK